MNLSLCGCGFLGIYHLGMAACLKKHAPTFLKSLKKIAGASAGSLVAAVLVIDDDKIEETMNLSLCGCGFLGIYHLGMAACLKKHAPTFLKSLKKIAGASAGSLVAAVLVIDDDKIEETMNLSLCGCGFLGIYHLGMAACLKKHAPTFLKSLKKIAGASAGSLVAAVLVIDDDKIEECKQFTYRLAKEVKSKPLGALTPRFNLLDSVKAFLDSVLPIDAHKTASGKLYISLTNSRTKKNLLVSEYESKDHLIQCLLASSHIPVYAGRKPVKINGQKFMDGGFSDNMVLFKDERTVLVSPFCGKQDISPQDKPGREWFINMYNLGIQVNRKNFLRLNHAMFPPSERTLTEYYKQGFLDTKRFLIKENLWNMEEEQTLHTTGFKGKETTV